MSAVTGKAVHWRASELCGNKLSRWFWLWGLQSISLSMSHEEDTWLVRRHLAGEGRLRIKGITRCSSLLCKDEPMVRANRIWKYPVTGGFPILLNASPK